MKNPKDMSGEELRREAKRADGRLGYEIDRLYLVDEFLKRALDWSLELEAEQLKRKNP